VRPRAVGPLLLVLLVGCAETTFEPSATTSQSAPSTTVFVPATGRAALLDQFDDELSALSERIIDNEGQAAALARIEAIWQALRADLESDRADLVPGFESVVELAEIAVARRRPADADKARLNAAILLAAASSSVSPHTSTTDRCGDTNSEPPLETQPTAVCVTT
jgi:hypothetical protein